MARPVVLALATGSLLAACAGEGTGEDGGEQGVPEGAAAIQCALAGAESFTADCGMEATGAAAREFVVWHPDGGFRRFERLDDGRWIAPADGADGAEVEPMEGGAEVRVAGDRYRLPSALFDHGGE